MGKGYEAYELGRIVGAIDARKKIRTGQEFLEHMAAIDDDIL